MRSKVQQALPLWAPQGAETYYYCTTCFNYKMCIRSPNYQNPSQCHAVHEVQALAYHGAMLAWS